MIVVVDESLPTPPYQQIVDQVVEAVRSGRLGEGARLPTVRQLAADLGLAVNTVAKAYKQLEAEGHVETQGRRGTFVLGARHEGTSETQAAATLFVAAARRGGLDLEAAVGLLRRSW